MHKMFAKGQIHFGNPYTDFANMSNDRDTPPSDSDTPRSSRDDQPNHNISSTEQADDRGYLDHMIDFMDGLNEVSDIASELTTVMEQEVSTPTQNAAQELQDSARGNQDPRAARNVARRLASHITTFNDKLRVGNQRYAERLDHIEHSLEASDNVRVRK